MQRRLKLWDEARVVEDDAELIQALMPSDYSVRAEQAIIFDSKLWDLNGDQHIPLLVDKQTVDAEIMKRDLHIAELESVIVDIRKAE